MDLIYDLKLGSNQWISGYLLLKCVRSKFTFSTLTLPRRSLALLGHLLRRALIDFNSG